MASSPCCKESSAPRGHSRNSHCPSFAIWLIPGKFVERFFGKTRASNSIFHCFRIRTGRLLRLMLSLFGKLSIFLQRHSFRLTARQAPGRDGKGRGEAPRRAIYYSDCQLLHHLKNKRFREHPGATAEIAAVEFADCSRGGPAAVLRPDPHKTIP